MKVAFQQSEKREAEMRMELTLCRREQECLPSNAEHLGKEIERLKLENAKLKMTVEVTSRTREESIEHRR